MAKLDRYFQKLFGQDSAVNQLGKFGSLAAGAAEYATDPDEIQEKPNFLVGWFDAIIGNGSPAIEDRNALDYLWSYQLKYILENGVAEWNAETNYFIGGIVNAAGKMYTSLTDNNLNNIVTDITKWVPTLETVITTKGDILIGNGTKGEALTAGADGSRLIASSGEDTGVEWSPATLVVTDTAHVYANSTDNTEMALTGLDFSFTSNALGSPIFVDVNASIELYGVGTGAGYNIQQEGELRLKRDGTVVARSWHFFECSGNTGGRGVSTQPVCTLVDPDPDPSTEHNYTLHLYNNGNHDITNRASLKTKSGTVDLEAYVRQL